MKKKFKLLLATSFLLVVAIILYFNFKREKVYTLKEYDPKTGISDISEYIIKDYDTIFQGKFLQYNKKGIKISEGQFVNDEPFGNCFYYYENGKIKSVHYRKDSKINLESTFYDSNGLLNRYVVCKDSGSPFFVIEYDKKGVTRYHGFLQLETKQHELNLKLNKYEQKKNSYKVGDVLKYSYILPNIPHSKRNFKIENISVDNSKVKRTIKGIPPTQIDVEELSTKKGKNTIRSIVRYEFNDKVTPVFTDTLSFDVNVN